MDETAKLSQLLWDALHKLRANNYKGVSQKAFADLIGINAVKLNNYLKAKTFPEDETLELIAKYFNFPTLGSFKDYLRGETAQNNRLKEKTGTYSTEHDIFLEARKLLRKDRLRLVKLLIEMELEEC